MSPSAADRLGPAARGTGAPAHPCTAPRCRRAPAAGILLCPTDADRLGQWLADIGDDYDRLDAVPTTTGWPGDRSRSGSLASQRAPARLDVLVLTDPSSRARDPADPDGNSCRSLVEVLGSWATTVRDEQHLTPTPRYDVPTDRRLLTDHLDWICRQDWVADLYIEIRDVWAQLKAATGQHPRSRPIRTCPALVGQPATRCGGPVRLDRDAAWCGHCGTSWSGLQLVRLAQGEPAA